MKDVPDEDRRFKPWGFGWRLQWPKLLETSSVRRCWEAWSMLALSQVPSWS